MTARGNTGKQGRQKHPPWKPGESGNPAGVPKAKLELRAALELDGPEIHAALMRLVRDDNPAAIIYAHQQIVGKPKEREEPPAEKSTAGMLLRDLSDVQLLSYMEAVTNHEATHGKVPQLPESNPAPSSAVIDAEGE